MRYIFIALFLFSGCSLKIPTQTKSVILTLKTPKIHFSDTAFINTNPYRTEVELYSASVLVGKLELNSTKNCFESLCYSKKEFNTLYLHESYDDTFLETLLAKKGNTIFKDEIHDIKITIREIE